MSGKKLKVLVLGGGPSSEHEISLKTAETVHKYLDRKKYAPMLASISKIGHWALPVSKIHSVADLIFIAMHGEFGEDGGVQAILDAAGVPYTGSGVAASALGMDKVRSRELFRSQGLNVPEYFFFSAREYENRSKILAGIKNRFSFPLIVKPADRGSSVGVSIVRTAPTLVGALRNALKFSPKVIAEEFIDGVELTCGVLDDGKNNLTPLLPTEIVPKMGEFFDYTSKYSESGADEITPARVPPKILKEAQYIALRAHIAVGCSGFSRTDMIWNKGRKKIYILEINTIPGLTQQSLLPKAAQASGISFPKLLDFIIKSALTK